MTPNAYDVVPYPSAAIPQARPDRVLLAAWFQGGPRPQPGPWRILEVGCGDGSNLLPMAFYRPGHIYLGVDAATRPIASAQDAVRSLGLRDIEFRCGDIRDPAFQPEGSFDLIIAHGFLSWVDAPTRAAYLDFCRASLAPRGVAYVSYNTHPGWKLRGLVREILWAAGAKEADPQRRSQVAMEAAARLRRMLPDSSHPYQQYLARELDLLASFHPAYVFHDYLSPDNQPFYFHEFMELVTTHDLRYLGDASFNRPDGRLPEGMEAVFASETVEGVEREQMMDILCNRQFRFSLLGRSDAPQDLQPTVSVVDELLISTALIPEHPTMDPDPSLQERFRTLYDDEVSLEGVPARAMLRALHEAGIAGCRFDHLVERAEQALRSKLTDAERVDLQETLIVLYQRNYVDLRIDPIHQPTGPSGTPHALATWEAMRRTTLTRPDHEVQGVDAPTRAWIAGEASSEPPLPEVLSWIAREGLMNL